MPWKDIKYIQWFHLFEETKSLFIYQLDIETFLHDFTTISQQAYLTWTKFHHHAALVDVTLTIMSIYWSFFSTEKRFWSNSLPFDA